MPLDQEEIVNGFIGCSGPNIKKYTPASLLFIFILFQIFRLSGEILEQVVQDDGEIQTSTVVAVYLQKTSVFLSLYKKYCLGLKRADCVLVSILEIWI